ncbi:MULTISPECIES: CapA family protein [Bacillaceae]|uniref:Capsular biosynthesis protein n=1 Tax=Gottfriedia luciferensis TaxID=178774 RepID=A0ABX2ZSX0_9BACI|nr:MULTISPECIES: CapA family protein [Bacillaceae]ODG92449.1 capsular biosynthesis protein [Gottfriedia luciferensis]PGZ89274.1 capsular biosynthesis protein [Bacillus sp. AFS029533]
MRSRKDKNTEKRNSKKIVIWFMILVLFGCISGFSYFVYKKVYEESNLVKHETENKVVDKPKSIKKPAIKPPVQKPENNNTAKPKNLETTIKISAAGDFTLGSDEDFQYINSFPAEANKNGLAYFTKGLNNIFKQDDLSTVNLETTLTNSKIRASKTFRFKGNPSYAKILTLSGIEAVNVANNHSHDYMQKGFEDTINNLKKEKIGYFGYNDQYVTTIKGIKVAALGYEGWNDSPDLRIKINNDIQNLRKSGVKIILIHFHWGIERDYVPNSTQKNLAHYAIDHGADLIVGHHPHVVQGIEEYKGKFIVYSLGNFMFGGNKNPKDKDTFVFQQTFHLNNGILTNQKEIRIVPFSISSVSSRNNYQPLFLKGPEEQRVKKKIIYVSNKIYGSNWTQYEK